MLRVEVPIRPEHQAGLDLDILRLEKHSSKNSIFTNRLSAERAFVAKSIFAKTHLFSLFWLGGQAS